MRQASRVRSISDGAHHLHCQGHVFAGFCGRPRNTLILRACCDAPEVDRHSRPGATGTEPQALFLCPRTAQDDLCSVQQRRDAFLQCRQCRRRMRSCSLRVARTLSRQRDPWRLHQQGAQNLRSRFFYSRGTLSKGSNDSYLQLHTGGAGRGRASVTCAGLDQKGLHLELRVQLHDGSSSSVWNACTFDHVSASSCNTLPGTN